MDLVEVSMFACFAALLILVIPLIGISCTSKAPEPIREVSFETRDQGRVFAHLYGTGSHGVVLAHGALFNKESWDPLAQRLEEAGYRVLAMDFRGYGKSSAGKKGRALHEDILAALTFLKRDGAKKVSLLGGSMGGAAAARAAQAVGEGEIHRLILLSPGPVDHPEKMKAGRFIFIASREEPPIQKIRERFQKTPEPKELKLLEGGAHAQYIFKTDQAEALTKIILSSLE